MIQSHGIIKCKYTDIIPISELKPHPQNPNKHSQDQLAVYAAILAYQGIRQPVRISNQSGFVTKGHGQALASPLNNWTHVPVEYQDYDNEAQEYADLVADNALAKQAELDYGMVNESVINYGPELIVSTLGIPGFEIEPADKNTNDPDVVPTPPVIPHSKFGEIYILGRHRLMCGDSTSAQDVERLMNGQKADMIFTDPPYGLGGYGGRNNMPLLGDEKNPSIFYQCIPIHSRETYVWGRVENLHNINFIPRDVIIWKKNNFGLGRGYRGQYEVCFYKGDFNGSDSDVWEIAKDTKYEHPTQKPIALALRAIKNSEPLNILDLFGGSGSTLIAAEATKIPCLMMEFDPRYVDVILNRWSTYTSQDPVRLVDNKNWSDIKSVSVGGT